MEATDLYTARLQVVEAMEQGLSWQEAAKHAGIQISQSTAYRLRQCMRQGGKQVLREDMHGHAIKLQGEASLTQNAVEVQASSRARPL